jgi:hypothetical protein
MYGKLLSVAAAAILLLLSCIDFASAAGGCGVGFQNCDEGRKEGYKEGYKKGSRKAAKKIQAVKKG